MYKIRLVILSLIILLLALGCIWVNVAFAAPFLVCDPQAEVTEYQLTIDGQAPTQHAAQPDGSARIDLGALSIADGEHVYMLQAGNVWGWSAPSDPLLNVKSLPSMPVGVGFTK